MEKSFFYAFAATTGLLVFTNCPTLAQEPAVPPATSPTLWRFLGIPQTAKRINNQTVNRNGRFPGLEPKPPLKPIADPENLKSDNPAIKKAAEIKKEEDLAKQKIKAVKYLASIGCGCHNRDGSITDALMKAMDDCTEEVRYETIRAISQAAGEVYCIQCQQKSCCSPELGKKLAEIAYELDDKGCFLEPSERVRMAAEAALAICCPGHHPEELIETTPLPVPEPPTPRPVREEPTPRIEPLNQPNSDGATPEQSEAATPASEQFRTKSGSSTRRAVTPRNLDANASRSSEIDDLAPYAFSGKSGKNGHNAKKVTRLAPIEDELGGQPVPIVSPATSLVTTAAQEPVRTHFTNRIPKSFDARVSSVNTTRDLALELAFADESISLMPGDRVIVYHDYLLSGRTVVAELRAVSTDAGGVTLLFDKSMRFDKISTGDFVKVIRSKPATSR